MIVLAFSDSHGTTYSIDEAMEREKNVNAIVFCGDIAVTRIISVKPIRIFPCMRFVATTTIFARIRTCFFLSLQVCVSTLHTATENVSNLVIMSLSANAG